MLPPYNTVHAQVFKKGSPPTLQQSSITVTYEAVADTTDSINTGSATKTAAARSFTTEGGTKSYSAKTNVGCYDCHNGPSGG